MKTLVLWTIALTTLALAGMIVGWVVFVRGLMVFSQPSNKRIEVDSYPIPVSIPSGLQPTHK
jgi:hypothetical protein